MSELVTRIPAETMDSCDPWLIPEMDASKVIPAIKQQKTFRTKKENDANKKSTQKPLDKTYSENTTSTKSVETIEDVIVEPTDIDPISAEELQKITDDAEKEGYDIGYSEGIEKGTKEGFEQGLKDGEVSILEKTTQLDAISEALLIPLQKEQEILEQQMVDMICQLTRSIVKKELTTDSSIIKDTVSSALALLQDKEKNISIHLHEQDIETIQTRLKDKDISAVYEVDNSLLPGGCRIDNAHSHIDASMDKQLEKLLDDFCQQRYAIPEEVVQKDNIEPENTTVDNTDKTMPDDNIIEDSNDQTVNANASNAAESSDDDMGMST